MDYRQDIDDPVSRKVSFGSVQLSSYFSVSTGLTPNCLTPCQLNVRQSRPLENTGCHARRCLCLNEKRPATAGRRTRQKLLRVLVRLSSGTPHRESTESSEQNARPGRKPHPVGQSKRRPPNAELPPDEPGPSHRHRREPRPTQEDQDPRADEP